MQLLLNTLQMAALSLLGMAVLLTMAGTVSAQPRAAEPVRIGVAVGVSGANGVVAPAVVQSSQLAVKEINANGGILGRPVQLEIMDDASGAEGAHKAVQALVFQKKVHALIAMQTSAATGMLMAASYFPSIDTAHHRSFRMRMLVRFGAEFKAPNELSLPLYEAFFQCKAAVEAAGSIDAAKVFKALGDVTVTGPRGTLRMGKGRYSALAVRLGQVRSDGSIRILETCASVDPGAQCPQLEWARPLE